MASQEETCSICLSKLEEESSPDCCNHSFCFGCLTTWSKEKAECPLCKRHFTKIEKKRPNCSEEDVLSNDSEATQLWRPLYQSEYEATQPQRPQSQTDSEATQPRRPHRQANSEPRQSQSWSDSAPRWPSQSLTDFVWEGSDSDSTRLSYYHEIGNLIPRLEEDNTLEASAVSQNGPSILSQPESETAVAGNGAEEAVLAYSPTTPPPGSSNDFNLLDWWFRGILED